MDIFMLRHRVWSLNLTTVWIDFLENKDGLNPTKVEAYWTS